MTAARRRSGTPPWKRIASLLCCLFIAGSAVELHELGHQHRDLAQGRLLEQAASHPRIPHHFDRSEIRHEAPCATCARQAQNHGVEAAAAEQPAAAPAPLADSPRFTAAILRGGLSSASPRGPPAA